MRENRTPAYDWIQQTHRGQASSLGGFMSGGDESQPDPDPDGKVLEAIRQGNTLADDVEHVRTLGALGYSIETVSDAIGCDVSEVEQLAEVVVRQTMRTRMDNRSLPDDQQILWALNFIVYEEEYFNFANILGAKDVAQQMDWDYLVEWIETSVETGDGYNYEVWLGTLEEAVQHNLNSEERSGTTDGVNSARGSISELRTHDSPLRVARTITNSDSPWSELDEHHTSADLAKMMWWHNKSQTTKKEQRIERLVINSAQATEDYRHFPHLQDGEAQE